jgi:hypothetical protein
VQGWEFRPKKFAVRGMRYGIDRKKTNGTVCGSGTVPHTVPHGIMVRGTVPYRVPQSAVSHTAHCGTIEM